MWLRNLFDSLRPGRSRTPIQKAQFGALRGRSAPRRLSVEALEDRSVPAVLAVSDVVITERVSDTQNAVVCVSLDAPSTKTVTVNYSTANGTALAGSDYNTVSGKLTFAPGETSKSILVPVRGDGVAEPDERFFVNLMGARNAKVADGQGVVTILDNTPLDNRTRISISDASVWGGYDSTFMTFTVSLAAACDETVTVNFAMEDGTAIAGQDYVAHSGMLTFAPGETTKTITVEIVGSYGSSETEYNEWFSVNLSGASVNTLIIDGQGLGSIGSPWGNFEGSDPNNTY